MARVFKQATATIEAQNTFTGHLHPMDAGRREFNISVSGITDSTVTLQRTFDGGATFGDVEEYTAASGTLNGCVEKVFESGGEGREAYRIGVKTGDYGSDTVVCLLTH